MFEAKVDCPYDQSASQTACKTYLRLSFLEADVLMPVAVHNATYDVQLAGIQLRQLIGRVCSQVHQVCFALLEQAYIRLLLPCDMPVFQARKLLCSLFGYLALQMSATPFESDSVTSKLSVDQH